MNILIANPTHRIPIDDRLERYFFLAGGRAPWSIVKPVGEMPRYSTFPFFLAYTAALLEQDGFPVQVVDAVPLNLPSDEFERRCVEARPDLILMEPSTPAIEGALAVCAQLKRSTGALCVLAGPHVTWHGGSILRENPAVDFAMLGEYEVSLSLLARRLRDEDPFDDLPGFCYREPTGMVRSGPPAAEIEPLDLLPPPARHLFPAYFNDDIGLYHDGFCQGRPAVQMHSSRGCPFGCSFCAWTQLMYSSRKHRCFPAPRVVDEMEDAVRRHGAREIYFDDDDFTANRRHVDRICEEIRRRNLKVPWSVMGDAMVTDEHMIETMAGAGCVGIKFGLESADPAVLERIGKPLNLDRVERVVAAARDLGIKTHATVSFGMPGETKRSVRDTFDFACRLDVDSIQFSVATPYPGTRFHAELAAEERLSVSCWEDYDSGNSSVVTYREFTAEFLQDFEATAWGRWLRYKLRQPRWTLRQLRYLMRLLKGQGPGGLWKRLVRGFHLLSEVKLSGFKYLGRHAVRR